MYSSLIALATTLGMFSPPPTDKAVPTALALEPEVADLSGYYLCNGQEGLGRKYNGLCVITKRNDVYLMQWVVGGTSFSGIGMRQGNVFSASWATTNEKGLTRGVHQYRIETAGPRLVGRWATLPGNGVMQHETLTFLRQLESDED
ncbi:MAG: hypothetical protein L0Y72_01295 [Gemmataceae bacterium]|nr:hypothetical protein [Gemmataceae bacterium]MCI0737648.1 hypothetical protein [Gemmataceae bacterium]